MRRALRRLVGALRFESVVFASDEEFLESLAFRRPACVVMNLHLPGLNGIETLERLRDRDRSVPVIMMTGFDQAGVRERCLAAGAAAYIAKPVDGAALTAALIGTQP
ncbi:MAG: response regulator [Amaricoccus sp.]|nr:response regulator [Amaricoccus sp.]